MLAGFAKKQYYDARAKAVTKRPKGAISMIIDAGGGTGCIHIPRFNSSVEKEPARHTMLKIKTTFIKVHRIESLLMVTIPDIEKKVET